jgi:hypothetical protein
MVAPSSAARESITCVSALWQKGHFIAAAAGIYR